MQILPVEALGLKIICSRFSVSNPDLGSSIILLISVIYYSVGLFLLRCSRTFKIVDVCFLLGYGYRATSVPLFFSVYFCSITKTSLYFSVVMCELLYLYVLSKCSTTEYKVWRDYILYGECLWTLSMKKMAKE